VAQERPNFLGAHMLRVADSIVKDESLFPGSDSLVCRRARGLKGGVPS
jgi:hypothetical protein